MPFWLLKGTVACVVAPGGLGKSTFVAAMALSLCTGRPLLGKSVDSGGVAVWLWNLEDDLDELSRSIQAAAKLHDVTSAEIGDKLFVDSALEGQCLCTAIEVKGEDPRSLSRYMTRLPGSHQIHTICSKNITFRSHPSTSG